MFYKKTVFLNAVFLCNPFESYLMTLFEQLLRKREFVIFGIPTRGKFYIIFYKEKRIRELPFPSEYILKFFLYFAQ